MASWRGAPWIKLMQVHNSQRAQTFLVIVSRCRVYQNMAFSHSLVRGSARLSAVGRPRCGSALLDVPPGIPVGPLTGRNTPRRLKASAGEISHRQQGDLRDV